jgi:hypothetical protein
MDDACLMDGSICTHAESGAASVGESDGICDDHLSGNYKGVCWGYWSNDNCNNVCITESSDNISGSCKLYKCWCKPRCASSEIIGGGAAAAASAPSIQP